MAPNRCMAEREGFEPTRPFTQRFPIRSSAVLARLTARIAPEARRANRALRFLLARAAFRYDWEDNLGGVGVVWSRCSSSQRTQLEDRSVAHPHGRGHQIKRLAVVRHDIVFRAT